MSTLPSSADYFALASRNGKSNRDSFSNFFECWLVEQNQYLQELISASKDHESAEPNASLSFASGDVDERILQPLINRIKQHYERYYEAKSWWAKHDVLAMFSPSWRSSLEDAFIWIGGWRPSTAFHLLYSNSGLRMESWLDEFFRGLRMDDLGSLSATQLEQVDELQRRIIRQERELTEKMAKHQQTVADASMVELSHLVTESMRNDESTQESSRLEERVESTLESKEEGLQQILHKADDLRLRTLKSVLGILSPIQAVQFLIAAAELHLRLHDWGKARDARHHHEPERTNSPH
ncbi:protein DOG1-like 3 [Carica papaya]|uniref:protein DOG1-like 3 n=1 Tax=Carica papaya TaxID=3649 RepID=UPI000B8C827D|nr:protein DOG1-like 3 [Carica papaya]